MFYNTVRNNCYAPKLIKVNLSDIKKNPQKIIGEDLKKSLQNNKNILELPDTSSPLDNTLVKYFDKKDKKQREKEFVDTLNHLFYPPPH